MQFHFRGKSKPLEKPAYETRIKRKPDLTRFMCGAAIAVYIAELFIYFTRGPDALKQIFELYGFSLAALEAGAWWTPFTSIFLHAGVDHLFFNLLALYFFGKSLEDELGKLKWIAVFFAAALAGNGAVLLCNLAGLMPAATPTIGMSAAIFGLLGATMLVRPLEIVMHPYIIPLPMILVAAIYLLYNIASFATFLLTGVEMNIAYAAHLGGLLAGACIGWKCTEKRRRLLALFLLIFILAAVPFIWSALQQLEAFNWVSALGQMFGK